MDQVSKWLGIAGSSNIFDNWEDIINSCLTKAPPQSVSNRSFKCNSWQCTHIADYLHKTAFIRQYVRNDKLILEEYKSAIKELCRAILEAELFLQDCSTADFWKNTNSISNLHTGEAYDVLLHDLIWSTAGLILAIRQITNRGDYEEIMKQVEACTWNLSSYRLTGLPLDRADFYRSLQNPPARLYYDKSRKKHVTFLGQKSKAWQLSATTKAGGGMVQHLNVFEIDPGDMGQMQFLGAGGHGDVYRSSCFGQTVAVKVFSRTSEDDFKSEASLLAGLQNPFIVNMVGWCKKKDECMLVMELAQTDLGKVIKQISSGQQLSWLAAVDIMLQISKGMEYLHKRRIMHRDIKPNNVLLEPSSVKQFAAEGHARVKLCDFGLAKVKQLSAEDRSRYTTLNMGTSYYRAPEVLQDDEGDIQSKYTRKADVFSFAITCSEILEGSSATTCYQKLTRKAMREKMLANVRPNLPAHCPSHLDDLMRSCWDTDPGRRPPFCRISNTLTYIKLILMRVSDVVMYDSVVTPFDEDELKRRLVEDEEFEARGRRSGIVTGDGHFQTWGWGDGSIFPSRVPPSAHSTRTFVTMDDHSGPLPSPVPRPSFLSRMTMRSERAAKDKVGDTITSTQRFRYDELRGAASGFADQNNVGEGRFSIVYRGTLPNGSLVAIKKLKGVRKQAQAEISSEIFRIGEIRHRNLLQLQGWCYEKGEVMLLYNYMSNGSLDSYLYGEKSGSLESETRLIILTGVALALQYLHEDLEECVLHRNVKAANVLLTENFEPMLGDFGLARLIGLDHLGAAVGTPGYVAPELVYAKVTDRADVYSFGVLALEVACGRRAMEQTTVQPEAVLLVDWVCLLHQDNKLMEALDPRMSMDMLPGQMEQWRCVLNLAVKCCSPSLESRPAMRQVYAALRDIMLLM